MIIGWEELISGRPVTNASGSHHDVSDDEAAALPRRSRRRHGVDRCGHVGVARLTMQDRGGRRTRRRGSPPVRARGRAHPLHGRGTPRMATTNDLKNGMVLNLDGQLWQVIWFQHHKPGKGGAVVRTKLKNVESGKTVDQTFNADVKVEIANVDKRTMQYLYNDGSSYVFMDTGTYDQLEITAGDRRRRQELHAGEPGRHRRHQRGPGALHRAARLGRARDHLHRAGPAGRPLHRRHQARHARDRPHHPGAAVHHHRREGQGRHPRLLLPRPRQGAPERPDGCPLQGPQARARHPVRRRAARRGPGDDPRRARSRTARVRPTTTPARWCAAWPSTAARIDELLHDVLRGLDARPDAGRGPQRALRIGVFELLYADDVPDAVAVTEAHGTWSATCRPTSRRPSSTACSARSCATRPARRGSPRYGSTLAGGDLVAGRLGCRHERRVRPAQDLGRRLDDSELARPRVRAGLVAYGVVHLLVGLAGRAAGLRSTAANASN